MSKISLNQININNFPGLEELDDNVSANLTGGMAQFIAFDDDGGGQSPEIEIPTQQRGFNLSTISRQIGINVDNIADRFTVTGTTRGAEYRILLFDNPDGSGNPKRIQFRGNGEDRTFSAGRLKNKVSIIRLKQLS